MRLIKKKAFHTVLQKKKIWYWDLSVSTTNASNDRLRWWYKNKQMEKQANLCAFFVACSCKFIYYVKVVRDSRRMRKPMRESLRLLIRIQTAIFNICNITHVKTLLIRAWSLWSLSWFSVYLFFYVFTQ